MRFLIVIIIILVVVITIFSFNKKFKGIRKRYSNGIDFYFTLIATIIGVLLAFYFSNLAEKRKDKQYVIDILEISNSNVNQNIEENKNLINLYRQVKLDSLDVAINALNYPTFTEEIIFADSKISQYISKETYKSLLSRFEASKKMRNLFHTYSFKQSSLVAEQYNLTLTRISKDIELEIELQKGALNEVEVKKKNDSLNKAFKEKIEKISQNPIIKK
ncbi:hypothetical protein JL193_02315 [Polaribacter batillariae]|uniref:Uncharacterized protein n=1 Tax=Polaribacter batillariae TaxID=2808900 RepID=A0ABX7SYT6_9FLAO|nr:hypothetical protein [Polaribacter batillariae]QTD38161.1 hypothetical protein JL193_02315 [Polaribacter batillariae]